MDQHLGKLLSLLGAPSEPKESKYQCPLHSRESFTLVFVKNNILPGGYRVKCDDPKCGFDGTVFDLMAEATGSPRSEVMSAFLPDGALFDTFCPSVHNRGLDRVVLEDHLLTLSNDKILKEFLKTCREDLMMNSELRVALSQYGIQENLIPALDCGLYPKRFPDELSLDPPKMGKADSLICPYTCGGMVTGLAIVEPRVGTRNDVPVYGDGYKYGIFQEDCVNDEVAYVCADEPMAMLLASKFLESTNKPSGAVCLKTTHAADHLPESAKICLLSTPDKMLDFHRAATYWKDLGEKRTLEVLELPRRISGFTGINFRHLVSHTVSVDSWLVDHLAKVNHKSGPAEVTKIVSSAGLRKKDKNRLLELLKEDGHDDPMFLKAVRSAKLAGSIMSYGKIKIRRNNSSYTEGGGSGNVLSNFVFFCDTVTKDKKGNTIIIGRVKMDDERLPVANASFSTSDLLTMYGSKITERLWGQLKEQGLHFTPYCADLRCGSITWFNVMTGFDESEYATSVASLGVQDKGVINFPKVRVDTTTRAQSEGGYMYGVDTEVSSMYGEIVQSSAYDEKLVKQIVESPNPFIQRLCLVLGHVAHQTVAPAVLGTRYSPKHLIIPYTVDEDMWHNVLCQASAVVGGIPKPTLVPVEAAEFRSVLKRNRQLETLPGIYLSRQGSSKRVLEWVYSSKNALVLSAPAHDLSQLSRESNTCFVYDEGDNIGDIRILNQDMLHALRSVWPFMLMHMADKMDVAVDTHPDMMPSERGLQLLADLVGAEPKKATCVITDYYAPVKQNGLDLFLSMMAQAVSDGEVEMCYGKAAYRKDDEGKYIGYVEGHYAVFHSKLSIEFLASKGVKFTSRYVRNDCFERGYLRSKQQEDIHVFVEVWEEALRPKRGKVLTTKDLKLVGRRVS